MAETTSAATDASGLLSDANARVTKAIESNEMVTRLDAADDRMERRGRPPVSGDLAPLIERAEIFARSGFFTDAKSVAQAAVKIMIGASIGLTEIAALSAIYLFEANGRTVITVGAHILAAKIRTSDRYRYKIVESTALRCELHFYERGFLDEPGWSMVGPSVYTIEEAMAGAAQGKHGVKDNWKAYPQDMLYARALARGFRRFTSDLTAIVPYVPEEFAGTDFRPAGMLMAAEQSPAAVAPRPRRASEAAIEAKWPTERREEWESAHVGADMPPCEQGGCKACRWDEWETVCAACGEPMARDVHSKCAVECAAEVEQPATKRDPAAAVDAAFAKLEKPAVEPEPLPPHGDRAAVDDAMFGKLCPKKGHGRYNGLFCPVCADPSLLREAREVRS